MTTAKQTRQGFPYGMTLATVIGLIILISLGQWQVQRLHWKQGVLASIAALQSAPPQALTTVLAGRRPAKDLDYTKVKADCPNIEATPFVRLFTPSPSAGFRIITVCRLSGAAYGAILVDRGFVAQDAVDRLHPGQGPILSTPVVGVLRRGDTPNFLTPQNQPAQGLYYWKDIAGMAQVLGVTNVAPTFLVLQSPAPTGFGPTPQPTPVDIPNNHLGYAITWFGLAASLLSVYLASLWRRRSS